MLSKPPERKGASAVLQVLTVTQENLAVIVDIGAQVLLVTFTGNC